MELHGSSIPLKNAILAFLNPRQAPSKAPRGEQNLDLRRDFVITSVRSSSLSNISTGC
jgi:hypothetical protein